MVTDFDRWRTTNKVELASPAVLRLLSDDALESAMTRFSAAALQAAQTAEYVNKVNEEKQELIRQRDAAIKAERDTRAQFKDLKDRLHASEMERVRLDGYLQRVAEDDHAREGFFEIDTKDGPAMRPKRPNEPGMKTGIEPSRTDFRNNDANLYGDIVNNSARRLNPVHWVNY